MSTLPDETLISYIKESSIRVNDAISTLTERYQKLVSSMVTRFSSKNLEQCDKDCFLGNKEYHVYRAAKSFDPERKTKFSSHLSNEVKFAALNAKKTRSQNEIPTDNATLFHLIDKNHQPEDLDFKRLDLLPIIQQEISSLSDKRAREILTLRYSTEKKNVPWYKIAAKVGLSIQGCINVHDAATNKLKLRIKAKYSTAI